MHQCILCFCIPSFHDSNQYNPGWSAGFLMSLASLQMGTLLFVRKSSEEEALGSCFNQPHKILRKSLFSRDIELQALYNIQVVQSKLWILNMANQISANHVVGRPKAQKVAWLDSTTWKGVAWCRYRLRASCGSSRPSLQSWLWLELRDSAKWCARCSWPTHA